MCLDELVKNFRELEVGGKRLLLSGITQNREQDNFSIYRRTILTWKFAFFSADCPTETLVIEGTEESVMSTLEKLKQ